MKQIHIPFEDLEAIARYYSYKCTMDGNKLLRSEMLEKEVNGLIKENMFLRQFEIFCKLGEMEEQYAIIMKGKGDFVVDDVLLKKVSSCISEGMEPYYQLYTMGADWLLERYVLDTGPPSTRWKSRIDDDETYRIDECDDRAVKVGSQIDSVLNQLKTTNDVGELTEKDLKVLECELVQLKGRFDPGIYRTSATLTIAESTLDQIIKKATGTVLSTVAKAALSACFGFFGISFF